MNNANFNLLMVEKCPSWYEHLDKIEDAMRQAEDAWFVRTDYGWDGDDGGEWGPNPLEPGKDLLAHDWEDTLALPFPEDFQASDAFVYELMCVIGKYKADPAVMAHMVALRASEYLGNIGHADTTKIRCQLRNSYVCTHNLHD